MPGPSSWPCSGQPGLEPQRVAGAEPGGLDAGAERRRPTAGRRASAGHGELDAVLAGVAGAGDDAAATPVPRRTRPTRNRPTAAASGTTAASRSRASGPCTARTARSAVTSAPPPDGVAAPASVFDAFGMTSKRSSSTHHTMMSSSTEPSSSSSRWVYWARPGPILPRSLVSAPCSRSKASAPVDPHGAEVADVEDHRAAAAGQVLGQRARRVATAACPSRRTAPSWRRGRGGRRRAASARIGHAVGCERASAATAARPAVRRSRLEPGRSATSWASISAFTPASGAR